MAKRNDDNPIEQGTAVLSGSPIRPKHVGLSCVLICYITALYFLVPTFNPQILVPGIGNLTKYAAITYVMGVCCAYFSRIFYVSDVSFRFELTAGLIVVVACFLIIGQPLAAT